MWREIANALKELLLLREKTSKNADDIKELQSGLKELTAVVQHLIYEVRGNRSDEAHEREKMALRLENELLKFERRLPSPN
ncbi:MAG: hypothetical protein ACRYFS_00375 [Janthinobacterium lividum]